MKPVLTKIPIEDFGKFQELVAENIEAIEPGLTVIDSRLLLGHAAIDLVARDAEGSLVLVALGFKADESLLLRIVEAYSWCLEYPESVRRHYPTLHLSEEQPPRVMFVIERVADSFQRKMKQINLSSVDVIEFRYIDVDGSPAPYFETVASLRRFIDDRSRLTSIETPRREPVGPVAPVHAKVATGLSDTPGAQVVARSNGHAPERVRLKPVEIEPVIAGASDAKALVGSAMLMDAPRLVGAPKVVPKVVEAPPVVEVAKVVAVPKVVEAPKIVAAPKVVEKPAVVEAPKVVEAPVVVAPPAMVEVAPVVEAPKVVAPPAITIAPPVVEEEPEEMVAELIFATGPTEPVSSPVTIPVGPSAAPAEVAPRVAPAVAEPSAAVAVAEEPAAAIEADEGGKGKHLFAEAARAAQIAKDFGIQLPTDGALTRQWIDFLNQLAGK